MDIGQIGDSLIIKVSQLSESLLIAHILLPSLHSECIQIQNILTLNVFEIPELLKEGFATGLIITHFSVDQ